MSRITEEERAARKSRAPSAQRSQEWRDAKAKGPTRLGVLKLLEKLARSRDTPPAVALHAMQALLEVLPAASILSPKEEGKPTSPWLRPRVAAPEPAPAQDTTAA